MLVVTLFVLMAQGSIRTEVRGAKVDSASPSVNDCHQIRISEDPDPSEVGQGYQYHEGRDKLLGVYQNCTVKDPRFWAQMFSGAQVFPVDESSFMAWFTYEEPITFVVKGQNIEIQMDTFRYARQKFGLSHDEDFLGQIDGISYYSKHGDTKHLWYIDSSDNVRKFISLRENIFLIQGVTNDKTPGHLAVLVMMRNFSGLSPYFPKWLQLSKPKNKTVTQIN